MMGVGAAAATLPAMDLDEWVDSAPAAMRESPMWKVRVYQIGVFVAGLAAEDATALEGRPRFRETAVQLVRAAGSIAATVAEGYSRQSRRDRIRYYEYALGSAREATTWYATIAVTMPPDALAHRLTLLSRACQLLLTMIRNERTSAARNFTKRLP